MPVFDGFERWPTLDELDALGAGSATTGSVSMFIIPNITPPFTTVESAFACRPAPDEFCVKRKEINAVHEQFSGKPTDSAVDFVHVGCPHASFEEMKEYGRLLEGKVVADGVELWVTTSRAVKLLAEQNGIVRHITKSGARVITDTCPMSSHFAQTTSPDRTIVLAPPWMRTMVIDSAKQAKYVRDMIRCSTLLTNTEAAIETAVSGKFVAPKTEA